MIPPAADGRVWSEQLGCWFGFERCQYLGQVMGFSRMYEADGTRIPTSFEAAKGQADTHRRRAAAAARRADRQEGRADAAVAAAETEKHRADTATAAADAEKLHADAELAAMKAELAAMKAELARMRPPTP